MEVNTAAVFKNLFDKDEWVSCTSHAQRHYHAWYKLVEAYTQKELTVPSDRLPAILDLADRFQRSFRVTFLTDYGWKTYTGGYCGVGIGNPGTEQGSHRHRSRAPVVADSHYLLLGAGWHIARV
jgi:hypothetical protein